MQQEGRAYWQNKNIFNILYVFVRLNIQFKRPQTYNCILNTVFWFIIFANVDLVGLELFDLVLILDKKCLKIGIFSP